MPAVPGWLELLVRLATARGGEELGWVRALNPKVPPSSRVLEVAAQAVRDSFHDDGAFERALRDALSTDHAHRDAIEERYRRLMEIPFASVLTTNQDDFLFGDSASPGVYEALLRGRSRWSEGARWDAGDARGWTSVVKLHGEANGDPGRNPVVLAQSDYRRRLYEDGRYANFLRTVFATRTVLFLGFSFTDAYLNELRSEVLAMLGRGKLPLAYALLPDVGPGERATVLASERLQLVSYPSEGGPGHAAVGRWIERLRHATCPPSRLVRALGRMGDGAGVVWVDRNHHANNGRLVNLLRGEGVGLRALTDPGALNPSDHASASLILCSYDWNNPVAAPVIQAVRAWEDRPPVVVFTGRGSIVEKRRRCMRLGAAAVCSDWDELYDAIERVLGVGDEADPVR